MLSALYKLESIECTVWRGVALPPDAMLGGKRVGQTIKWWCFISTTLTSDVLEKFIGSDEQKKNERTIFKIKSVLFAIRVLSSAILNRSFCVYKNFFFLVWVSFDEICG